MFWPRRAPTEGTVREAVGKLEVTGDGEDVEEVEEDVHGHDGHDAEAGLGPDAPQLTLTPHWLHLAHLGDAKCLSGEARPAGGESEWEGSPTGDPWVRGEGASSWRPSLSLESLPRPVTPV